VRAVARASRGLAARLSFRDVFGTLCCDCRFCAPPCNQSGSESDGWQIGGLVAETAERAFPAADAPPPSRRTTFRDVFADGEFRAIWLAEFASIAGDQFARVALTVIVYQRTGSPLLTALTYAMTYLPWLVGGLFLSDLADRFPRRTVMIAADVARMLLVAAMAVPGMPLWGMVVLLFVVASLNAPFQ